MILKITNTLIRIGFLAMAFCLMSWIPMAGVTFSGGFAWALALGAASAGVFALAMPLVHRALGIAPNSCPCGKTVWKLGLSFLGLSCLQVAAAALIVPSVVTLSGWLAVFPGGLILLLVAVLSNIPTRVLEALFGAKPESKS